MKTEYGIIPDKGAYTKPKQRYKRSHHITELLKRFQSKESTNVPDKVYEIIRSYLQKQRIKYEECTEQHIRLILKKYKLTTYYKHTRQIYYQIAGIQPIILPTKIEEKIISMFQEMQEPFIGYTNRKNFLSDEYVLNKLFLILGMKEHAECFRLLKCRDKLRDQDRIICKICKELGWDIFNNNNIDEDDKL